MKLYLVLIRFLNKLCTDYSDFIVACYLNILHFKPMLLYYLYISTAMPTICPYGMEHVSVPNTPATPVYPTTTVDDETPVVVEVSPSAQVSKHIS